METGKKKSLIAETYRLYASNLNITLKYSAFISFLIVGVFFLLTIVLINVPYSSIWGFFLIIIVIYLIIRFLTPYLYSFFACNHGLCINKEMNFKVFFSTRIIGKSLLYRNILRIIPRLAYSYLLYIVMATISICVILFVGENFIDTTLYSFIKEFDALYLSNSSIEEIYELFSKYNELIYNLSQVINFISLLFASFYFIHSIAYSFINYYVATLVNISNPKKNEPVNFKKVLKEKKFNYFKGYFKTTWPLYLLGLISFSLSYFLCYKFFTSSSILIHSLISLTITLVFLFPFLPVVLDYNFLRSADLFFLFSPKKIKGTMKKSTLNNKLGTLSNINEFIKDEEDNKKDEDNNDKSE